MVLAMLEFTSSDAFYDLNDTEASQYIGKHFRETGRTGIYFPIQLSSKQFNYGRNPGLIFISEIRKINSVKVFKLGAVSPDDLDCDLDYSGKVDFRQDLIQYCGELQLNKAGWTYKGFLQAVLDRFPGGKLYS